MEDIIEITDDGMVRVTFEKTDGTHTYRDALYFTQELYNTMAAEQIEAIKQERFDNWVAVITYVAPEEIPVTLTETPLILDPLQENLILEEIPPIIDIPQESIIQE